MIEFLLNDELVQIDSDKADLTVLDYLREQRFLVGTKEGCASGDCGACTAVTAEHIQDDAGPAPGESADSRIQYRNFNSCITFLGSMHGKQLLTVEHLKDKGVLHPVQQSMVDAHGSQCGFCTPGFIMSMFSLYKSTNSDSDDNSHNIEEYLAGNLCRCTGYRPIVNAASAALSNIQPDQFSTSESCTQSRLKIINHGKEAGTAGFLIPQTAEEVVQLLDQYPQSRLLGGGTDLALEVTQQLKNLDKIIYLGNIAELRETRTDDQYHDIGTAVSLTRLDQLVQDEYPEMSALLKRFGSRQVRNTGTIGGNIANASPIGDLPPVLLALNASAMLQGSSGTRIVPLDKFFLSYRKTAIQSGEFLRSILLPRKTPETCFKVYKISKRLDDDISAVCLACCITVEGSKVIRVRIGLGGMDAVPRRALKCEQVLLDNPWNPNSINLAKQALQQEFSPIDDVRASASYRMKVSCNLLDRLYQQITDPGILARIEDYD